MEARSWFVGDCSRFGSAEVGGDERKKKRMGKNERRKMRDGAKLLEGGEE